MKVRSRCSKRNSGKGNFLKINGHLEVLVHYLFSTRFKHFQYQWTLLYNVGHITKTLQRKL
jgi:hypothetical protein